MVGFHRLNGTEIWLNPLMIESIERTPDTILTLSNGHKYVVQGSQEDCTERIQKYLQGIGLVGETARANVLDKE
jgi:flagellar protein FlbD